MSEGRGDAETGRQGDGVSGRVGEGEKGRGEAAFDVEESRLQPDEEQRLLASSEATPAKASTPRDDEDPHGSTGASPSKHSAPPTPNPHPPSPVTEAPRWWEMTPPKLTWQAPEPWPPHSRFYRLVWARRTIQALALLLFVYLAISARQPLRPLLPVDLFLRLDPLAQLSASVAAREAAPYLLWAVPLGVAAALIGRFFCGWLCPLGAALDMMRFRHSNGPRFRREKALRKLKYLLMAAMLVAALAGSTFLLPLDPLTLLTRSFALAIYPAFNAAVTGTLFTLYDHGILQDLMVWIDTDWRGNLLPLEQPIFQLSWLFLLLFVGVVGLNLLAHRFWCRYLCPLGAMLSLLSRTSLVSRRVSPGCAACGRCQTSCRMGAVEPKSFDADVGECVLCGECRSICPDAAVSYGAKTVATSRYDPSRRGFLLAGGVAVLGVAGLRADSPRRDVNPYLVRPPGAGEEADFLDRCIRCGQCMKACPTSGLQPSITQSGLDGLWSPVLVSRIGACLYDCTTCGQVCPTSAIKPLDLETKRQTIIGTAYIDQKRCLPWADNRNCIVCEELCPVSPKAVVLDSVEVTGEGGEQMIIKRPRIVRPRCIGCGICENKCPLPGEAAIRVYNTSSLLSETGDVTS